MAFVTTAPLIAGFVFVGACIAIALRGGKSGQHDWVIAALLATAFLVYSLYAIAIEGPTGFWPEHTRNLWGVQIWFDLLLAAGVAWFFVAPRARAVGMPLLPWFFVIPLAGSIGLLVMAARVLWLERHQRV